MLARFARTLALLLTMSAPAFAGNPTQANFEDSPFLSGLSGPTSLAWAPDDSRRLFITLKNGLIITQQGGLRRTFAKLRPIYTGSECGLLGLCFDPNFVHNGFVYAFITVSASEQRIVRLRDLHGVGVGKVTIVPGLPTRGINHDGGAIGFGHDARLYWAIGDNGVKRGVDGNLTNLAAKVGRAAHDGSVPLDNPFRDGAGPRNEFIWATGFRNPFTMAFQPRTGALWLNVVGSSPEGQTEPRSTAGHEQIFLPKAGDDGGYDDFEGNQLSGSRYTVPFARPLIRPVVQYKTDYTNGASQTLELASIERHGGILTAVTKGAHPYRVGQIVNLTNAGDCTGYALVASVGTNTFTATDNGADTVTLSDQGSVTLPANNGSITGGAFYESTVFPTELRGAFYFGDSNAGTIWQVQVNSAGRPAMVRRLVLQAGLVTDISLGPDGALYYSEFRSGVVHRVSYTAPTELIVTPTTANWIEGGDGVISVRLPSAPAADVTVAIVPSGNIAITTGSSLTYTPENWSRPQAASIRVGLDDDTTTGSAALQVSAVGFATQTVNLSITDTTALAPVLSKETLTVPRGGRDTFTVRLPSSPPRPVTLVARRFSLSHPQAKVKGGATLTFTPQNWNQPQTVTISEPANAKAATTLIEVWGRGYFRRSVTVQPSP